MRKSKWTDKKEELIKLRLEQKLTYLEIAQIMNSTPLAIKNALRRMKAPLLVRERKIKERHPREKRVWRILKCAFCGKEFKERISMLHKQGVFIDDIMNIRYDNNDYLHVVINVPETIQRHNKEFICDTINWLREKGYMPKNYILLRIK